MRQQERNPLRSAGPGCTRLASADPLRCRTRRPPLPVSLYSLPPRSSVPPPSCCRFAQTPRTAPVGVLHAESARIVTMDADDVSVLYRFVEPAYDGAGRIGRRMWDGWPSWVNKRQKLQLYSALIAPHSAFIAPVIWRSMHYGDRPAGYHEYPASFMFTETGPIHPADTGTRLGAGTAPVCS